MIRRRALLATPLLLAAPALRAQSLILRWTISSPRAGVAR